MNSLRNDLDLTALRRQMAQARLVHQNVHNLAKAIFKPGMKVQYSHNSENAFGVVVGVVGEPGSTRLRVEIWPPRKAKGNNKTRDINVEQITGLVREQ